MINFQTQQSMNVLIPQSPDIVPRFIDNYMSKRSVAFRLVKPNEVFYYTQLNFPYERIIEAEWFFKILENSVQIKVAYSTIRTLGFISKIAQQRAITQISLILKQINMNNPKETTVILSKQGILFWRSVFQFSSISYIQLKKFSSLLDSLQMSMNYHYPSISPFIITNNWNNTKNMIQKEKSEKQQILRQLKIKIKCFENYRQSRRKSTYLLENGLALLTSTSYFQKINPLIGYQYCKLKQVFKYSQAYQQQTEEFKFQDTEKSDRWNFKELQQKLCQNPKKKQAQTKQLKQGTSFILTGIRIIEKQKKDIYSNDQGSHSVITSQKIKFSIEDSISQSFQIMKKQLSFQYKMLNIKNRKNLESFQQINSNSENSTLFKKQIIQQKILAKKIPRSTLISQNSFKNQIQLLTFIRNCKCDSIAKYHLQANSKKDTLLMPFYNNSLATLIKSQNQNKVTISFYKKLRIFEKIVKGIQFLSKKWILHRDLKPSNIMINEYLQAKIIDFGSCCTVFNHKLFIIVEKRLLGTPGYYFPYNQCHSVIKSKYTYEEYDEHLFFDSYSLGKILDDLFFDQKEDLLQLKKIIPQAIMEALIFIKERCLDQNPDDRLSAEEILSLLSLISKYGISENELNQYMSPNIICD